MTVTNSSSNHVADSFRSSSVSSHLNFFWRESWSFAFVSSSQGSGRLAGQIAGQRWRSLRQSVLFSRFGQCPSGLLWISAARLCRESHGRGQLSWGGSKWKNHTAGRTTLLQRQQAGPVARGGGWVGALEDNGMTGQAVSTGPRSL